LPDPFKLGPASLDGISAISIEGIRKAFGATVAADDVSFVVSEGQIHALLGENGAGKSTIVKLLSGLIQPDAGTIRIFGEPVRLTSPRAAHRLGIQTAFQEMMLVGDLTVLDNMLLPYAPINRLGLIRRRRAEALIRDHFAALDLDVDLYDEVRDLDLALQQRIEIARAVFRKPRILLLDEPTSSLSGRDIDWLGAIMSRLRTEGVTLVFISHRLPEVRRFCDHLTVLRNGRDIATKSVAEVDDDEVIRMIIGRSLAQTFPPRPADAGGGAAVLGASGLAAGRLKEASFTLHRGEILGVAGLQGMGQLELFLACFGMIELDRGQLAVDGKPVSIVTPSDAVRAEIGISLVPEDRKSEALFLKLSGRHNASLPIIGRFTRAGLVDLPAESEAVARIFDLVQVDQRALWTRVGAFSGGNQQKIALAKWLLAESRILLLFDPTRGIDVGTKHEFYLLMRRYAAAGGAILFYSTEIAELVNLADRVLIMYGGRVVEEIGVQALSEEAIMRATLGGGGSVLEHAA
jgi:ribose transport system ATP-binding protein